jgi:hypothetical protein
MNIITVNHTDLNGNSEALDVVMADEAIAEVDRLQARIQELKCCGNCKWDFDADEENCDGCCEPELNNWEAR